MGSLLKISLFLGFTLLVSGSIRESCENCVEQEKIFYRGLFPNSNFSTTCVWSSTQLPPGYFVFGRGCTLEDCVLIERPTIRSMLTGNQDCQFIHPLARGRQ